MSISEIKTFQDSGWEKPSWLGFSKKTILKIIEGGSILDIGCGDGLLLEELLKVDKARNVIGLDISDKAIERARTQRGLDCRLFDITQKLPFENDQFDAVLLMDVLEHVFMPEAVLNEAVRVSRKNIYISVPNFVSLPARLQVLFGKVPENNTQRKGHTFWFTRKVLRNLIKKGGLNIELEVTNTFWETKFLVGKAVRFLARIWPELFALSFIIKARKI